MQTTMTKHQRLTIYIQSLLIALVSIPTLTSCVHDRSSDLCIEQEQEDPEKTDEPETYISLSLAMRPSGGSSLRAHPDGVYSINTDQTDWENYVSELRVILYQGGEPWEGQTMIKENIHLTGLAPGEPNALSPQNNEIVFPIKERGSYGLFVIANETAGGLLSDRTYRLDTTKYMVNAYHLDVPSTPFLEATGRFLFPMSYEPHMGYDTYIDLDHPGTKHNPHQIILEDTHTGGIELVRLFAKVEVTIKDCVQATKGEDGSFIFDWLGPWGFDRVYDFGIKNYYEMTSLYSPPSSILGRKDAYHRTMQLPATPDKAHIVGLNKLSDEAIGGVQLLDYKSHFYIPENIQSSRSIFPVTELSIRWHYYPDPYREPERIEEKEQLFKLPGHDDAAGNYWLYEWEPKRSWPREGSIFRNNCYRLTINPYRADVSIF